MKTMILKLKRTALRSSRVDSSRVRIPGSSSTGPASGIKWTSIILKPIKCCLNIKDNAQATTALFFVFIRVAGTLYFFRRERLLFKSLWRNPRIVKTNNEYRKLKCSEFIAYEINS